MARKKAKKKVSEKQLLEMLASADAVPTLQEIQTVADRISNAYYTISRLLGVAEQLDGLNESDAACALLNRVQREVQALNEIERI